MNDFGRDAVANWFDYARYLIYLVLIAWIVSVINFSILGGTLSQLGVRPRTLSGLGGVVFAPFLHGSWGHLEGNTIAFLTYGGLILLQDPTNFLPVTATVALTSGLGTWLFGRDAVHIGASGVTFGYLGFLLFLAVFDRSIPTVLLLVFVAFFYSNRLWGLLPIYKGVSWEEHVFGFLGGIYAARSLPQIKAIFEQFIEVLSEFGSWLR